MKHEYFDPDPEHALRVLVRELAHFDQHPEAHHHLPPGSVAAVEERIHAKHRRRAEKLMRGQGKLRK